MMTPQDSLLRADTNGFCLSSLYDSKEVLARGQACELLQQGIDLAAKGGGGRVELASGEYPITSSIELRAGVTLAGRGRSTRLRAAGGLGAVLSVVGADGVELRDMVLTAALRAGASTGVDMSNCGDILVSGVHAKGFAKYGFHIRQNAFLSELRGCKAWDCGEAGVCLRDLREKGRAGEFVPNLLSGCVAAGGGVGFALHHALVVNLMGCQVFQSGGHGFHLTRESNSVALTGCRTFQVGGDAYRAEEANELCLSGNIFCWPRSYFLNGNASVTLFSPRKTGSIGSSDATIASSSL